MAPTNAERAMRNLARLLAEEDGDRNTTEITKLYQPDVDRTGDKIIVPEGADLKEVIEALQRKDHEEQQKTQIIVNIPVPPWDGAIALKNAIEDQLGVVIQKENFWTGATTEIEVEVSLTETVRVPWGEFRLPSMENATVMTDAQVQNNRLIFVCVVTCKKKYEGRVRRLLDEVRRRAMNESLHKGKAFSIAFTDSDGDREVLPKPRFFAFSGDAPIFTRELELAIERNVFVPIQQTSALLAMGESLKRGVLFAGDYGTGKTMLANYLARTATAAGWTFIYVKDSSELQEALWYAEAYQPVVVFAEDIDRVAGAHRSDDVNILLNQLDGIDAKVSKIMTILTTNHPNQVNEAMRRPGRIDTVLEIKRPDAEAVGRMIEYFAGGLLEKGADVTEASEILAGDIPARIRETVGRAKLESLRRTKDPLALINGVDLAFVAREVKEEYEFFSRRPTEDNESDLKALSKGFRGAARRIDQALKEGNGAVND